MKQSDMDRPAKLQRPESDFKRHGDQFTFTYRAVVLVLGTHLAIDLSKLSLSGVQFHSVQEETALSECSTPYSVRQPTNLARTTQCKCSLAASATPRHAAVLLAGVERGRLTSLEMLLVMRAPRSALGHELPAQLGSVRHAPRHTTTGTRNSDITTHRRTRPSNSQTRT